MLFRSQQRSCSPQEPAAAPVHERTTGLSGSEPSGRDAGNAPVYSGRGRRSGASVLFRRQAAEPRGQMVSSGVVPFGARRPASLGSIGTTSFGMRCWWSHPVSPGLALRGGVSDKARFVRASPSGAGSRRATRFRRGRVLRDGAPTEPPGKDHPGAGQTANEWNNPPRGIARQISVRRAMFLIE